MRGRRLEASKGKGTINIDMGARGMFRFSPALGGRHSCFDGLLFPFKTPYSRCVAYLRSTLQRRNVHLGLAHRPSLLCRDSARNAAIDQARCLETASQCCAHRCSVSEAAEKRCHETSAPCTPVSSGATSAELSKQVTSVFVRNPQIAWVVMLAP